MLLVVIIPQNHQHYADVRQPIYFHLLDVHLLYGGRERQVSVRGRLQLQSTSVICSPFSPAVFESPKQSVDYMSSELG